MKELIFCIGIIAAIVVYWVIDYRLWLSRHKKSMKKLRDNLEESKWRKENWNKTAPPQSIKQE